MYRKRGKVWRECIRDYWLPPEMPTTFTSLPGQCQNPETFQASWIDDRSLSPSFL